MDRSSHNSFRFSICRKPDFSGKREKAFLCHTQHQTGNLPLYSGKAGGTFPSLYFHNRSSIWRKSGFLRHDRRSGLCEGLSGRFPAVPVRIYGKQSPHHHRAVYFSVPFYKSAGAVFRSLHSDGSVYPGGPYFSSLRNLRHGTGDQLDSVPSPSGRDKAGTPEIFKSGRYFADREPVWNIFEL